ncbi:DUF3570 domain-containing protein [Ferruginibacter lapsinanis]|uniref:DUF3570 domain-containing protein n=1 Tax=Ferruginibacter lapsinanis TaxID=563172 RepID=UPI001E4AC38B|nr:DUF3570 domain-containing protein [Ferruginibacter lapsinanis]UEG49911.1 DUF3570 domain-containing protein [Ferruginibacter lapsinanis]
MKKICLVVVGLYLNLLNVFSQSVSKPDTAEYQTRKLKLEEVNLISSYYHQDGNNSSVTGGIGTEKLTDFANIIDVKFTKYDTKNRLHTFTGELGVDTYSSASSDKIDLKANSSASSSDIRIYPSVSWSMENKQRGTTIGLNASSSTEFDYQSFGLGASFSKKSKDNNREVGIKAQAYLDQVKLIYPIELRTTTSGGGRERDDNDYASTARNSFTGSLTYSQIVNQRLQLMFLLDLAYQQGFLALPFHRVILNDNTHKSELLPSSRFKIPVGIRANYFAGDKVIIRTFYRFYHDDWGLTANTADIETSIKVTPFFSVTPFYRYYNQSAIKYFAPYMEHTANDAFYTSNYDLSKFDSHFLGAGIRLAPPKGVFGIQHFSALEIRYGHYNRSNGLNSNIVSLNIKYK